MNIFAIEGDLETGQIDWEKSAQSQDNLRVVKMILESCQILSTVLNEQGMATGIALHSAVALRYLDGEKRVF